MQQTNVLTYLSRFNRTVTLTRQPNTDTCCDVLRFWFCIIFPFTERTFVLIDRRTRAVVSASAAASALRCGALPTEHASTHAPHSQRVAGKVIRLAHLRDEFCMPDIFTKWVSAAKRATLHVGLLDGRLRACGSSDGGLRAVRDA